MQLTLSSPRFQLFLPQCLSSIGWWGRGCAVWSKEPTLSSGWLCLELLPEHAAGSSFKVSSLKPSTTHTVHSLFIHHLRVNLLVVKSSPSSSITSSDRLVCAPDRRPVPAHLPLAWTHSSAEEIQSFMTQLETMARVIQSQPDTELNGHTSSSRPQFVWVMI